MKNHPISVIIIAIPCQTPTPPPLCVCVCSLTRLLCTVRFVFYYKINLWTICFLVYFTRLSLRVSKPDRRTRSTGDASSPTWFGQSRTKGASDAAPDACRTRADVNRVSPSRRRLHRPLCRRRCAAHRGSAPASRA